MRNNDLPYLRSAAASTGRWLDIEVHQVNAGREYGFRSILNKQQQLAAGTGFLSTRTRILLYSVIVYIIDLFALFACDV